MSDYDQLAKDVNDLYAENERLKARVAALTSERDAAHARGREEGIELAWKAAVREATHRRELSRVAYSEASRGYLRARDAGAWDTIDAIARLRSPARAGGEAGKGD